jgi:hypothetical protein
MKERQENRTEDHHVARHAVKTSRDRHTEVQIDRKTGRTDSQRLLYVTIYKDRETVRTYRDMTCKRQAGRISR